MSILAGMRITSKDGFQGVVVKPGEPTAVMSLSAGEIREWTAASYTADEKQDISSVFVVNPQTVKVSTIMWGVLLGNLLTGFVGAFVYYMIVVNAMYR
jgi:hypothetical protein